MESFRNFNLVGDVVAGFSSIFHILTCRTPKVMRELPSHTMPLTKEVHRFCWKSLAEPLRWSIFQTYKKPSFAAPREASHRESGDHATALTPKVCSVIDTSGVSDEASCRLKIRTRGAYPVSPTARYFSSLLRARQVAAFIRSRLVQVFDDPGESEDQSPTPACGESRRATRPRLSFALGVPVGVEGEL
jgi:hypothetical protein